MRGLCFGGENQTGKGLLKTISCGGACGFPRPVAGHDDACEKTAEEVVVLRWLRLPTATIVPVGLLLARCNPSIFACQNREMIFRTNSDGSHSLANERLLDARPCPPPRPLSNPKFNGRLQQLTPLISTIILNTVGSTKNKFHDTCTMHTLVAKCTRARAVPGLPLSIPLIFVLRTPSPS